jgi:hypothetical protein
MTQVWLFLSTVSREFRSYRNLLRQRLQRHNVTIQVQEDFIATGTETLDKLDLYIKDCNAVIHLVGDMTGAWANETTRLGLKARYPDLAVRLPCLSHAIETGVPPISYTQWEAYLAIYHRKVLLIATPAAEAPRDSEYAIDSIGQAAQREHLKRLTELGRYSEITFTNPDDLVGQIAVSTVLDLLAGRAAQWFPPPGLSTGLLAFLTIDGMDTIFEAVGGILRNQFDNALFLWSVFGALELAVGIGSVFGSMMFCRLGVVVCAIGAVVSFAQVHAAWSPTNGEVWSPWFIHQTTMAVLFVVGAAVYGKRSVEVYLRNGRRLDAKDRKGRNAGHLLLFLTLALLPGALSIVDTIKRGMTTVDEIKSMSIMVALIGCIIYASMSFVKSFRFRPRSDLGSN